MGHVRTVPGNMHVKFEDRSFHRFGAIIERSAAHIHTDTHRTTQYLRRSLRSLGVDKYIAKYRWTCSFSALAAGLPILRHGVSITSEVVCCMFVKQGCTKWCRIV